MHQIERGILYEDSFLGVTLGGIVSSHGTIMIDAPLRAEDARTWRSVLINQRGGSNRILVNLDAHPDRTLGGRAMDCTVLAHQKTAQVFRNRPMIFKGQNIESGAIWETYNDAIGMRWVMPDITFAQRMSLHWGGSEVILEHHPGPNSGAIWAIIPAHKVMFVGDMVVLDQPPFLSGADFEAWLEGAELLLNEYREYKIICGRGGLVDQKVVREMQKTLKKTVKGLEKLAERNSVPEATEKLVPSLLADYSFPPEWQEFYTQRLRYGLYQYYARRYRPSSILEQTQNDEEDQ